MLFTSVLIGIFFSGADAQSKTLTDVLAQLKATENAVGKLWNASRELDQNMTKLEHDTAKVMSNETTTSTQLLQLEFATKWNNKTLLDLSYWTTQVTGKLDFEKYDLSTTDKAKKDTATAAKTLATKAKATVTKANLTKLEEIATKIWRVSDPQSGASLDKTEARLKAMDTDVKYIRGKLDPEIKEKMKKKLRRNMDRWRDDNMKLGIVALRNSGELSKYYLKEETSPDDDSNAPQWPLDNDGPDINGDEWFLQALASKSTESTGSRIPEAPSARSFLVMKN